jgi:hypothetical protein
MYYTHALDFISFGVDVCSMGLHLFCLFETVERSKLMMHHSVHVCRLEFICYVDGWQHSFRGNKLLTGVGGRALGGNFRCDG